MNEDEDGNAHIVNGANNLTDQKERKREKIRKKKAHIINRANNLTGQQERKKKRENFWKKESSHHQWGEQSGWPKRTKEKEKR